VSAQSCCPLKLSPEEEWDATELISADFYLQFCVGHVDNIYSEQREEPMALAGFKPNALFNSL